MEIIKASGEKQTFDREKLCRSLKRAGAPRNVVTKVCSMVEKDLKPGTNTEQLSKKAAQYLREENLLLAAKYSLRHAIMQLGPSGFFFEEYVAAILEEYGYSTKVGQILKGKCVTHEIDIVAEKDNKRYFIEVKYHNRRGLKSDVQVAMYMYARFLDIKQFQEDTRVAKQIHKAWLVTNTKFTKKATRYAECMEIYMTGWRYPQKNNLEDLIIQKALYPVTVLPSANRFIREQLAQEHLMFVKDMLAYSDSKLVKKFGIQQTQAKKLLKEAYTLV